MLMIMAATSMLAPAAQAQSGAAVQHVLATK